MRKITNFLKNPIVLTTIGLLIEGSAVWAIVSLLKEPSAQSDHLWLFPIFGAMGGVLGSLLPEHNDNKFMLCEFKENRIKLGVVGDVALGLGGASTVFFLFGGTLEPNSKPVIISISLIAGVFGRQVLLVAGAQFMKAAAHDEARRATAEVLENKKILTGNSIILTEYAEKANNHHQYRKALEYSQAAIDSEPERVSAYVQKGIALRHMGRLEDALQAVEDALSHDPDRAEALYNKACYKSLLQRPIDEVLFDLKKSFDKKKHLRVSAKEDPDFSRFKDDTQFRSIVDH